MQQGYVPPGQEDHKKRRSRDVGKNIGKSALRVLYIFLIVIGLMGFIAETNMFVRLFLLAIAVCGAVLLYLNALKGKNKKRPAKQQTHTQTAPATVQPETTKPSYFINSNGHKQNERYEYVECKVAGVTFKNGRRGRQTILRQIRWQDEPYDGEVNVNLRLTEYEGKPAVEVWANQEQIGYIPKDQAFFFAQNWNRFIDAVNLVVHGGGTTEDDEKVNYGATFVARFHVAT